MSSNRERDMAKTGKRLTKAYEGIDPEAPPLRVDAAVKEIKSRASAKFDETVEIAINLDRAIATPDMMALVGRLGKILGPRGLMPNPRLGTVTQNVAEAVQAAKGGQVEFRAEKAGIVHAGVGKASFTDDALVDNVRAFVGAITRGKPSGVKGTYIKRVSLSSSMGPAVKVELAGLAEETRT